MEIPGKRIVYTIGHSNHALEHFLGLLKRHRIEVVVDVRSKPHSRFHPHFNKKKLEKGLLGAEIQYVFLGRLIGGLPDSDEYYDRNGYVLYHLLARSPNFMEGIERLEKIIGAARTAIMCAEEDPAGCHRRLLIGRVLLDGGLELQHIRKDGVIWREAKRTHDMSHSEVSNSSERSILEFSPDDPWKSSRPVRKR